MKVLKRVLEYLKKIFYKKQRQMLVEANNKNENIENRTKEEFFGQLKIRDSKPLKVETEICVQNGLGFEGKIKG